MTDILLNGMKWAVELSEAGMDLSVAAGLAAVLPACIAGVLQIVAGRWLNSRQMMILWVLVLIRLAMPVAPESRFSLQSLLAACSNQADAGTRVDVSSIPDSFSTAAALPPVAGTEQQQVPDGVNQTQTASAPAPRADWSDLLLAGLPWIWLTGATWVLLQSLLRHWRFGQRVASCRNLDDARILTCWRRSCAEVRMAGEIPVVVFEGLSEPAVFGAWRPRLILPMHTAELPEDQLRMVMLHELMHIRSRDAIVNWLLVLVRAAQWWNPVLWLAESRFVQLRERVRDALVLRHFEGGDSAIRTFGELLGGLAERGRGCRRPVARSASLLSFGPGRPGQRAIAGRIRALSASTVSRGRWHQATAGALIGVLAVSGLSDAGDQNASPEPAPIYSDNWRPVTGLAPPNQRGTVWESISAGIPRDVAGDTSSWTVLRYDISAGVRIVSRQQDCAMAEVPDHLLPGLSHRALPTERPQEPELQTSAASTGESNAAAMQRADEHSAVPVPSTEIQRDGDRWTLIARGPSSFHQQLVQAIRAFNRSGHGQVGVEVRIATTPYDVMQAAGLSWDRIRTGDSRADGVFGDSQALPGDGSSVPMGTNVSAVITQQVSTPVMTVILDDARMRRFIGAAHSDTGSNILFAPKVVLLNGHQGTIQSGSQQRFVHGAGRNAEGRLEPEIHLVQEGMSVRLHPELTEEHQAVDLVATVEMSSISDVRRFDTEVAGQRITVEVPQINRVQVSAASRIASGQTLLMCIPPAYKQNHFAWVMLTPRILDERVE